MNLMCISGNLGKDCEVKYTPNGKAIGTFSVAIKSGWGDNEKTTWITCKLFGDRAEKLAPYLLKGTKHTFSGEFQLDEWEKDGVKNKMPVLILDKVSLGAKPVADNATPNQMQAQSPDNFSDDIPFMRIQHEYLY